MRLRYFGQLLAGVQTDGMIPPPRAARPVLATLNLTENCQARCVMCDYWTENSRNLISADRSVSLIEEISAMRIPDLRLLGGEPLLRKDLFTILDRVQHLTFRRTILATNGMLLSRLAHQVNRSNISHVTVSIDGYGMDHDWVRGTSGAFEQILEGLDRLEGKRIKIGALVSNRLANGIDRLLSLCAERAWMFDIVLPSFDLPFANGTHCADGLNQLWPSASEANRILTAVQQAGHITGALAGAAYDYLVHRKYPQRVCVMGYINLQVRANGDLLTGCYELKPLGNVLERSIGSILTSQAYGERLQRMLRMDCEGCVCGWQLSYLAENPLSSIKYVRSRLS